MSVWLYVPLLLSQNYLLVARQADLVLGRTKSCKFRILSTSAVLLLFSHSFTYWHLLFLKADLPKIRRMVELEGVVQLSHLLMKIAKKHILKESLNQEGKVNSLALDILVCSINLLKELLSTGDRI